MTTFKTTKGNQIVINPEQWCYEWKDVREYLRINENVKAYLNIGRDYIPIDETMMSDNEISYILGNDDWKESVYEEEQKEFIEKMEKFLRTHYVIRFKVSDMGSSWMYIRILNGLDNDANWFLIGKNTETTGEEMKQIYNFFRAYVEWIFFGIQIFSPKVYTAEDWAKVRKWNLEEYASFFTSEDFALKSYDSNYWWEIIKKSECKGFMTREEITDDN